jgi:hypothetical protein
MPAYRIYKIDRDGRISSPPDVEECSDDQEAIARAEQRAYADPHEVWLNERLVAKVGLGASSQPCR